MLTKSKHLVAKTAFVLAIAVAASCPAIAGATDSVMQIFFVSGILQKTDEPTTVKLVHIVQAATSRAGAEAAFKHKVRKDFPGFNPIDTIATPQSDIRAPDCMDRRFGSHV